MRPTLWVLAFFPDDAWYYFEIAARLAEGGGSTFDGIHSTNGYHPLWLGVCLAVFAAGGGAPSIAAVQVGFALVGLLLLLKSLNSGVGAALVTTAFVCASFSGLKIFVNGLESSLAFACFSALFWACVRQERGWVLGLFAGLTIVSRWNAVLLVVPLLGMFLARQPVRQQSQALAAMLVPVCVALGLVWLATGHFFPVSAAIKLSNRFSIAWTIAGVLSCIPLGLVAWRHSSDSGLSRARWALAVGVGAIVVSDIALRRAVVPEIWTLWPHVTLLLVVAPALRRWQLIAIGGGAIGIAVVSWTHRLNPESYSTYAAASRSGQWLDLNAKHDDIAAGWDVGYVAGHTSRAVVNLDGLVNSWEYKRDVIDRQREGDYLDHELRPRFVVQDVPIPLLRSYASVPFKGARLGGWYVARAECIVFRAALSPWKREERVALVLSRDTEFGNKTLTEVREELCRGDST